MRQIYEEILFDPNYQLTEEELAWAHNFKLEYGQSIDEFRKAGATRKRIKLLLSGLSAIDSSKRVVSRQGKRVVDQLLLDPELVLTDAQKKALNIKQLEGEFSIDEEAIRSLGREAGPEIRAMMKLGKVAPRIFLLVASAGFSMALMPETVVKPSQAKDDEPLPPDEFEIVYTSPLPHAYIRIGSKVYSYGVGIVGKLNWAEQVKRDRTTIYGGGSRRVSFKVSPSEVDALKNYLETEVGKAYLFTAAFNLSYTCVSSSHRAINQNTSLWIPPGINRSSVLTEGYFKLRKLFGDKRVASVEFHPRTDNYAEWKSLDVASSAVDALFYSILMTEGVIASQVDRLPHSVRALPPAAVTEPDPPTPK